MVTAKAEFMNSNEAKTYRSESGLGWDLVGTKLS